MGEQQPPFGLMVREHIRGQTNLRRMAQELLDHLPVELPQHATWVTDGFLKGL